MDLPLILKHSTAPLVSISTKFDCIYIDVQFAFWDLYLQVLNGQLYVLIPVLSILEKVDRVMLTQLLSLFKGLSEVEWKNLRAYRE